MSGRPDDQSRRSLTSDYAAEAWLVWDVLESGRADGALVRLITPIASDEPMELADRRLGNMLRAAIGELSRFIAADIGDAG